MKIRNCCSWFKWATWCSKNELLEWKNYNELLKELNNINTTDTSDLVKKMTEPQKLMKLKTKLILIIIITNYYYSRFE